MKPLHALIAIACITTCVAFIGAAKSTAETVAPTSLSTDHSAAAPAVAAPTLTSQMPFRVLSEDIQTGGMYVNVMAIDKTAHPDDCLKTLNVSTKNLGVSYSIMTNDASFRSFMTAHEKEINEALAKFGDAKSKLTFLGIIRTTAPATTAMNASEARTPTASKG